MLFMDGIVCAPILFENWCFSSGCSGWYLLFEVLLATRFLSTHLVWSMDAFGGASPSSTSGK